MSTASLTFDERYRAIDARDARFDGQFVTAVRSTGIYSQAELPGAHAEARERDVLPDIGGGARGGIPRLQAVPAGSGTGVSRLEPAR